MDTTEMVSGLAPAATIREISTGRNRVFRLLEETGRSSVVKVYGTPSRERRERHALEALSGVKGVPTIIERGATSGMPWIRMSDGGSWDLSTLPKNLDVIRRAGAVLRAIHDTDAQITNLDAGIDGDYVAAHFKSTLDRLGRFRRKVGLPADVLDAARTAEPPPSSEPRPAHTRPGPVKFVVAESGDVTLIDWGWATLAPREWDLSFATWRFTHHIGEDAAEALFAGYGASFPQDRLRPWIVYHAASMLLDAAEVRDGRLADLGYLIDDLSNALT